MTEKALQRANEIVDRINLLSSYVSAVDADIEPYITDNHLQMKKYDSKKDIKWTGTVPNEYKEMLKEEIKYAQERIINKMRKEIDSLTKEIKEL